MTYKLAPSRNNGSRLASSKNNNSRPVSGKNDSDSKVNGFGCDVEHTKKLGKSKDQKTSQSQKSAKSGKISSKIRNPPNFGAIESEPSFLTPETRSAFNCLWLAFTKAPILQHFDLECHI